MLLQDWQKYLETQFLEEQAATETTSDCTETASALRFAPTRPPVPDELRMAPLMLLDEEELAALLAPYDPITTPENQIESGGKNPSYPSEPHTNQAFTISAVTTE